MQITKEKIEAKQTADIKIIVEGILEAMPSPPYAIYLCGGQGRGEGAWFVDSKGNVVPYNDYDIAVVSDCQIEYHKLQCLRKKLAEKVSIHWVDIDFYSPIAIANLTITIHNVDLLYASKLIWGKDYLKENAPQLKPSNIGNKDLDILYRTRMWTLLGSWSGCFHDLSGEEARFFKNQMAKCILAACDMILIKNHMYTTSYKERVEIVKKIRKEAQFSESASWAIQEKLFPTSDTLSKEQMIELYNRARNIFFESFVYSYGENSKFYMNPDMTHRLFRNSWKSLVVQFLSYFIPKYKRNRKSNEVFYAQNYILHAYTPDSINKVYVNKASSILKKWGYGTFSTWEELHEAVANARNNI